MTLSPQNSPPLLHYWMFLGLVFWVPIPLGSNRGWAWAIVAAWVALLVIGWLLAWALGRTEVTYAYRRARPVMVLLAVWISWLCLQVLPLPMDWLGHLSPQALAHHQAAPDVALAGGWLPHLLPANFRPISIDPSATLDFLVKSASYTALFALTLLLVTSRARLRGLGYALVLSGLFQAAYGGLMTLSGVEWGFGPK